MLYILLTTFGSEPSQQLNTVLVRVPAGCPWTLIRNSHRNGHTFFVSGKKVMRLAPLGQPLAGFAVVCTGDGGGAVGLGRAVAGCGRAVTGRGGRTVTGRGGRVVSGRGGRFVAGRGGRVVAGCGGRVVACRGGRVV